MTISELTRLKEKISEAKRQMSQREGVINSLTAQLKKEYGITPEQIQEQLVILEKRIRKADSEIEEVLKILKEKYGIE